MTKPHWLKGTKSNWSPDVIVAFDTESVEVPDGDDLVHTLRCWDAIITIRHSAFPHLPREKKLRGETAESLVKVITDLAKDVKEIWILAHNLNFDLSVTQMPLRLAQLGWHIDAYGLAQESNWWVFKQDGIKIIIADSWSWLPTSLENIGKDLRMRKRELPKNDESLETWHARCRKDAEILSRAMLTILDWWDSEHLGIWKITSSGCGWAAMCNKIEDKSIVVGADESRTPFERKAIYAGRKDIYQVGEFKGEWVSDCDFVAAYPTVAAHFPLPTRPGKPFIGNGPFKARTAIPTNGIIANCTITTEYPIVPVRYQQSNFYPVGTFTTILAQPEIEYAIERGATIEIHSGYEYRLDFALRPWSIWCLSLLHKDIDKTPEIVRRMAKGWSRSVIGRFATHSSRTTRIRPYFGTDWKLETGHNLRTGHKLETLSIGPYEITTEHDLDGINVSPAMLAFVESYCRVALSRTMDTRHPSRLMQCNTDGWWERRVSRNVGYELNNVPWPFTAIRKACVNSVRILGPDHLETLTQSRLAGVSKGATRGPSDAFTWHDWPSLAWQIGRGETGSYRRPSRSLTLSPSYARRWVLATGETVPVTFYVDSTGENQIKPWSETMYRRNGDVLADYQDPLLMPLADIEKAGPVIFDRSGPWLPGRRTR